MKKLLLCLLVSFSFLTSKAQPSIAIIGGFQNASVSPDYLVYPDTLTKVSAQKTGIVFGFIGNLPIGKNFFLRTGVIYSSKGSNWTQYYDTSNLYATTKDLPANKKAKPFSVNSKLNVNYIDIPFNLMYKLPLKKTTGIIMGIGPYASIFYNGTSSSFTINVSQDSVESSSVRTSVKESNNSDLPVGKLSKQHRVIHVGMNAFLGIEFNRIFFNANYARNLNEFYEEDGRQYKHKTTGLTLGVFLGQRPKKN